MTLKSMKASEKEERCALVFCDALRVIPTVLRGNGRIKDNNIYDVSRIKYQGFAAAIETVCLLLRVDRLIRAVPATSGHRALSHKKFVGEESGYRPTRTKSCSGYIDREDHRTSGKFFAPETRPTTAIRKRTKN